MLSYQGLLPASSDRSLCQRSVPVPVLRSSESGGHEGPVISATNVSVLILMDISESVVTGSVFFGDNS